MHIFEMYLNTFQRMLRSYHYHSLSGTNHLNDVVKITPRSVFKTPDGAARNETTDRAMYWRNNGEVGMSSLTIWCHLMDAKHPEANKVEWNSHPYDVDDFRRCYLLLEAVPEWKEQFLSKGMQNSTLAQCSKTWMILVDAWPKLTQLYEDKQFDELKSFFHTI